MGILFTLDAVLVSCPNCKVKKGLYRITKENRMLCPYCGFNLYKIFEATEDKIIIEKIERQRAR